MTGLDFGRRRLTRMLALNFACLVVAAGAAVGYLAGGIAALGPVFVAAIAIGVGAQVCFIVGIARGSAAASGKA